MDKIHKKNKIKFIFSAFFLLGLFLLFSKPVFAWDWKDTIDLTLGTFAALAVKAAGWLLTQIIGAIVSITSYNDFVDNPSIVMAWKIVRDFCNMGFILILLVIAFATILRIESYNMKQWLPRLILMAILINFSRTICGILIDASQIVMLTFVNAFSGGGGNFVEYLKIREFLDIVDSTDALVAGTNEAITASDAAAAYALAVVFMIVAIVAVLAILVVFIMRVIMFWILVTLSPLAFLMMSFPGGRKYAGQYWSEFTKYLINGPVLAFFIWLAMITITNVSSSFNGAVEGPSGEFEISAGASEILTSGVFIPFVIGIGFLVGGLMMASQAGGMGASWGMSTVNRMKSKGINMSKGAVRGTWGGAKSTADWINRKQYTRSGVDLNLKRVGSTIKSSFDASRRRDLQKGTAAAERNLGMSGMKGALTGFAAPGYADQFLRGPLGLGRKGGIMAAIAGGKGRLEKLQGQADDNRRISKLTYKDEADYEEAKERMLMDREEAKRKGDNKKVEEIDRDLQTMKEYKGQDPEVYLNKALDLEERIKARSVDSYEGQRVERQMDAEEMKNIANIEDEDELTAQFQSAVAKNNAPQARAIAKALTKIGGFDTLLSTYGYNRKSGFTKEEAERVKKEDPERYKMEKGVSDFMRDVFVGKLKQNEQSTYRLQNDLGDIGNPIGHTYLASTVSVDKNGTFKQLEQDKVEERKFRNKIKREPEKVIRNHNRYEYGAENDNIADPNNNFEWSDAGMAYFIDNINLVSKEIGNNRFNKSAAKAVTQKTALRKLKQRIKDLGIEQYKTAKGEMADIEDFYKDLERYSNNISEDKISKLLGKK